MKTYNVKLKFKSPEDKQKLLDSMIIHNDIWNYISNVVFTHDKIEKKKPLTERQLHDLTYHKIRQLFPSAPSQLVIRARADVASTYQAIRSQERKAEKDRIKKQKQTLTIIPVPEPTKAVRKQLAIRLDKRLFTYKGTFVKITTLDGRIDCDLHLYKKVEEFIAKYPMCDPMIFERKGTIYLSMTFENPEPTCVVNSCIGVDLGFNRIAVTSEGKIIKNSAFIKRKREIQYLRDSLHKAKKNRTKPSDSARKHLKKINKKEINFSKNYMHHLANELVKTKSNVIVFEDLSNLKKTDRGSNQNQKLGQIPFYKIKMFTTYKAQALGKRVETVNPAYTSKNDYRGIKNGVRKGCRYYTSDGKVFDSDLQGSINVAQRWGKKNNTPVSFVTPEDGRYEPISAGCVSISQSFGPGTRQA